MKRALPVAVLALALAGAASTAPGQSNRPRRPLGPAATTTPSRFSPQSISFVSPSVGWAWGPAHWIPSPGVLARTVDGGRTWRFATITGATADVEGWSYVAFTGTTHAVAVP